MNKLMRLKVGLGVLALMLLVPSVPAASAALTLGATTITADGDLTVGTVGTFTLPDMVLADGTTIQTGVVDGTTLYGMAIAPVASEGDTQRNKLVYIGSNFEATEFYTYGIVAGFTRESEAATATFDGVDTGLDLRVTNEVANNAAYGLQGAYIKAKNEGSTTGVVGTLKGMKLEVQSEEFGTVTNLIGQEIQVQNDGTTAVANALGLKFTKGSGGTGYFTDIQLQNGAIIAGGAGTDDATITAQVDDAAVNGLYLATDGKVWILQTGTWTQLTVN
ncbi:MAG: hypothetical protein PHV43_02585 [Candidatus Colwellbacteria bacterium]|nr:hypothetical protein [Candidatus Colwellbacteria bacterium]